MSDNWPGGVLAVDERRNAKGDLVNCGLLRQFNGGYCAVRMVLKAGTDWPTSFSACVVSEEEARDLYAHFPQKVRPFDTNPA